MVATSNGASRRAALLGEVARADDQHPLARELLGDVLVPLARVLAAHEARQLPVDREQHGDDPLGGGAAVRAAAVRQRDVAGSRPIQLSAPAVSSCTSRSSGSWLDEPDDLVEALERRHEDLAPTPPRAGSGPSGS